MQHNGKPSLAVLLASYNGAAHIREQVQSIAGLDGAKISVFVSDDGSSDNTKEIVASFFGDKRLQSIEIGEGPKLGFAANFKSLISSVSDNFDYYAFSDQDDLWLPNKFTKASDKLSMLRSDVAGVYCGRTEIISDRGDHIGYSPMFSRVPSFRNAIVQSIAGGNTMILNNAAMRFLKIASERNDFVAHDWFCYLVVSACGGTIFYDAEPTVRYRQHDNNLIGSNSTASARLTRILMLFSGRFSAWNGQNIEGLEKLRLHLTDDALRVLNDFKLARTASLPQRFNALRHSGVYRQTLLGTISLFVACLFKRL